MTEKATDALKKKKKPAAPLLPVDEEALMMAVGSKSLS
jgi:hypothetical protein